MGIRKAYKAGRSGSKVRRLGTDRKATRPKYTNVPLQGKAGSRYRGGLQF